MKTAILVIVIVMAVLIVMILSAFIVSMIRMGNLELKVMDAERTVEDFREALRILNREYLRILTPIYPQTEQLIKEVEIKIEKSRGSTGVTAEQVEEAKKRANL